jgi:hypothetical protein
MKRRILPNLLAGAALLLASACSDAVAPDATSRKAPTASPDLASYEAITTRLATTLTLDPRGNDYTFGSFRLHVPAGSVCDPATSGYGPGTWDLPCAPITQSLVLRAELSFQDGRAWVDFHPNVRFAPSQDRSGWVTLTTRRYPMQLHRAYALGDLNSFAMLYAPSIGASVIDEGGSDRSMVTHVNLRDGEIWRRLKHFSGFTITAGFACEPNADNNTCGAIPLVGTVEIVPGTATTTLTTPP